MQWKHYKCTHCSHLSIGDRKVAGDILIVHIIMWWWINIISHCCHLLICILLLSPVSFTDAPALGLHTLWQTFLSVYHRHSGPPGRKYIVVCPLNKLIVWGYSMSGMWRVMRTCLIVLVWQKGRCPALHVSLVQRSFTGGGGAVSCISGSFSYYYYYY